MFSLRQRFRSLLAGDAGQLAVWTLESDPRWFVVCCITITITCGIYGGVFGLWRSELQSVFSAIKFPLLIFLTCAGNALLNGCIALVLGVGIGLRQSMLAILMSFTITGLVLAAFAPLLLFLLWNVPPLDDPDAARGHSIYLLAHVVTIAYAGIVGNHRLFQMLRHLTGKRGSALLVLLSWLGGNLLLGSQISWIIRPWIGLPNEPVTFLRADPLRGSFLEAVWSAFLILINHTPTR